ncbi:conserved hypothetical protein [Neospora caninum Liverpool]|uniref:Uncharacterized protein n=1 Tax=Neospora caninum (strain Liverpool) TaxID=572307 RepID=F0VI55_NEOCL|nr:conserved hypothetical protein [Neospora caninum Liverpool]CBZ53416.1 conserved hypothetical protein [Neospora caninum Liverpool]CEL67403.1 TPA: hypothetical protein BN1204_032030 [Neospora caninum Liverpool]|eukprot:XP_003883448.1 conserved hypothetical protein [Neospora caninum Liverpool]
MPLPEPPEQMPLPEPPESIAQRLRRIQQKARELKKENKTLHERLNSRGSALEQETKNSHDSVDAFAGMQREILAEYEQLLREQQAEIRALQEQLSKMDSNVSSNQGNSTPAVDDSSYCSQPSLLCRWLACVYGSGNDDARSELKNTHGVLRTTVLPAETTPPGL